MTTIKTRKKLIEVALPLEAINVASAREKSIRHGHPSTLHLYWARRPLAAARAVIFAQMVDDPSANPDLFQTEKAQDKERQRLFRIIEDLVKWENSTNERVLQAARDEIWASWRRACTDNASHPEAGKIFDRSKLPAFHDPFAGGGALPLEAQRLGLESHATDLNPVAVLINKAMIEIPPRFTAKPPVNPDVRKDKSLFSREWKGVHGLAEDVRHYGQWMRSQAAKRIGHLYPQIEITAGMTNVRPDLKPYEGQKFKVISWLWARTVKSPNPAFAHIDVPLASTFILSTKQGKEAYVEPVIHTKGYSFSVKVGKSADEGKTKNGTKAGGSGSSFLCLMSGTPMPFEYLRAEAKAGRMGSRLMAIVAEGPRGRVYLAPTPAQEDTISKAKPAWKPEAELPERALGFRVQEYGMKRWCDLFTERQLVALTTFSDLVSEAIPEIRSDALKAGLSDDPRPLRDGGLGAVAYAEAVAVYLAIVVDKAADYNSTICSWISSGETLRNTFGRQAIPMVWDYCETNTLGESTGSIESGINQVSKAIEVLVAGTAGAVTQADAQSVKVRDRVISTDPPYYDNIGYADLSDFFYVWMRRSLQPVFPSLFSTMAVPKAEELVATPFRHGNKVKAEAFFLDGMTKAMGGLCLQSHPAFPVTIYYAFKQSESDTDTGTASTGWETFLDAVIRAGFDIGGTWPMRTERSARSVGIGTNALASSIILVCSKRSTDAPTATRRDFISALKSDLPGALRKMQEGNVAPVDLAQAAIGPGIAVYTRYSKIIGADGKPVSVREALALINQVLDEQLAEQEGDLDGDTRWAVNWFDEFGFDAGAFGRADDLARAKNTAVHGVVEAGIAISSSGKVRILKPDELPNDWAPETDNRLTVWEMLHHLIRLQRQGEEPAAVMLSRLGDKADAAKELAYRLYGICERKKRSAEGQLYNDLIVVWPDLVARSKEAPAPVARPGELNLDN